MSLFVSLKPQFLTLVACMFALQSIHSQEQKDLVAGQLFVQLSDDRDFSYSSAEDNAAPFLQDLVEQYAIQSIACPFILDNAELKRTYLVHFNETNEAQRQALIAEFERLDFVRYAEALPLYHSFYVPNDAQYAQQWHLAQVQAEQAWDQISTQASSVVIAVVDDAVLLSHQDLSPNLYVNPNEIAGNGVDDDGNGYVDDVTGWDAANNDNDPNPLNPTNSYFTHGTHVAGIAAGATDNSIGIASLGFAAKNMPVKIGDDSNASLSGAWAGVQYAIAANANVINMSWGGGSASATYQTILDQGHSQGIVLVAAAGNSSTSVPMYPASYNHVISVGATGPNDAKASFSNYGTTIDVMAPGVGIYSSLAGANNSYANNQGTSMACPMVAGLAALIIASNPALSPDEVEDCIKNTCDNINAQNTSYTGQIGAGRINAYQAVLCAKAVTAVFDVDFNYACLGQTVNFTDLSTNTPTSWNWSFPGGTPSTSTAQNPSVTYNTAGTYNVSLIATNAQGTDTTLAIGYITVGTPSAVLSGGGSTLAGYTSYLIVNMIGSPPWDITYSDGSSSTTITGITSSPQYIPVAPTVTTTYNLTAFSTANCAGTYSGSATVTIVTAVPSSECYYSKYYGDSNINHFHSIHRDPAQGEMYIAGSAASGTGLLSKLDDQGNLLWSKSYPAVGAGFSKVVGTPNGDLILLANPNEDIFLMRVDPNGNVIWSKSYDMNRERALRLIPSLNDTYIVGYWYAPSGTSDDASFMRVDGNGNIMWTSRFHNIDDQIYSVHPDGLGGAYFSGGLHGGGIDMFVGTIDINGVFGTITEYTGGNGLFNEAKCIVRTMNNEYLTVSQTRNASSTLWDLSLKRLDANFNLVWESSFASPSTSSNVPYDVLEDTHGGVYVSTHYPDPVGGNSTVIIKFDAVGNYLWTKQMTGTQYLRMQHMGSAPVDNLLLHGGYDVPTNFGQRDAFLARTDTALNSCLAVPVTSAFLSHSFTTSVLPITNNTLNMSVTTNTVTANVLAFPTAIICDTCGHTCDLLADFSATTVCVGDTTFFTDLSTYTNDTITTWAWDFGDGSVAYGVQHPDHVYASTGVYTVSLVVGNGTVPICLDTILHSVTVVDQLLAVAGPDTMLCLGDSLDLNVQAVCGSAPYTYNWSPSTGLSSTTIANPSAHITATITYTVLVTDGNGNTSQDMITITVDPNCCTSHANLSFNAPYYCEGDAVTFSLGVAALTGANYDWDFGPSASPSNYTGAVPPTVVYSGSGSFPVSLILSDSCGVDTALATVNIFPRPNADAGADTAVCYLDSAQIGGIPFIDYSYSWTPASSLSNANTADPIASGGNSTNYTITVTDNFTGCTAQDQILVEFHYPPVLNWDDEAEMCPGDSLLLDATNNTVDYLWQDGSTAATYMANGSGLYWVQLSNACGVVGDSIVIGQGDCLCSLYVPNSFTPDGDGNNEVFRSIYDCRMLEYEMLIFDRWGELLYESNDSRAFWDGTYKGKLVQNSVYVYRIRYRSVGDEHTKVATGHVSVLR